MSVKLDENLKNTGTKFYIFPQPRYLKAFKEPEEITISVLPCDIKPGPADNRIYVVDVIDKVAYTKTDKPPYKGLFSEPVKPGEDGHFTYLDVNSRAFSCATMYATVRRVLDIWEDYFGHPIYWHFETDFDRLELIPLIKWNNAHSGYGFLEFGYASDNNGGMDETSPYCQNFDVLAHELGHSIIFSEVGVPTSELDRKFDYMAMHESAGDLVAIISSLHFNLVVDHLLKSTSGNLFTVNELDRVGELESGREIRVAFNNCRMSDVGFEPYERSKPLTGGVFDIMVEVFQKKLLAKGLITQELADASTQTSAPTSPSALSEIQQKFNAAYVGNEKAFKDTLLDARDYIGQLLATCWSSLNPNFLSFHDILRGLIKADRKLAISGGEYQKTIRECFSWREIAVLPQSMLMQPHSIKDCYANGL